MNSRRAALLGVSGLGALSLAAAAVLGVEAIRSDFSVTEVRGSIGGAAALMRIDRDLASFRAALAGGTEDAPLAHYGELRSALGATMAQEALAKRLAPQDIEQLARLSRDLDQLVVSGAIATGGDESARALGAHAAALAERVLDLAQRDAQAVLALDATLDARGGRIMLLLVAAALALAAVATALVLRRPAMTGVDPAVVAARQAAADEAARLARARFVMMMSHELRTPLNGVLGLLSVMKEAQPPETLRPLIDQAERAGQQLTAMLHDMLEVESGQAEPQARPATAPSFQPGGLVQSMRDLYAPLAAVGGPSFTVDAKGPLPAEATGDGVRFQRAVSHLCSHVMDTAGVEDVALEISHTGDEVRAELSFGHRAGPEAGMRLVEPPAGSAEAGEEVTGVGLGPLLAKGLLEQMGGRLEIATLDSGRILVLAASPSHAVDTHVRPRVRVIARTRSLGALGSAAAAAAGVDVLTADTAPEPDIVLVEAGGEEEPRAVAEVRSQWPEARLMALGEPDSAHLFDDLILPPLDPARVADAVAQAWQHCQERRGGAKNDGPLRKAG